MHPPAWREPPSPVSGRVLLPQAEGILAVSRHILPLALKAHAHRMCNVVSTHAYGARKLVPAQGARSSAAGSEDHAHVQRRGRSYAFASEADVWAPSKARLTPSQLWRGQHGQWARRLRSDAEDLDSRHLRQNVVFWVSWHKHSRPSIYGIRCQRRTEGQHSVNMQRSVLHSAFAISCDIDSNTAAESDEDCKVVVEG